MFQLPEKLFQSPTTNDRHEAIEACRFFLLHNFHKISAAVLVNREVLQVMATVMPLTTKNPFHEGEVMAQRLQGIHQHVMSYGPKFIRPAMPDQHREFFASQPFLAAAIRDESSSPGRMWSTLLIPNDEYGVGGDDLHPVDSIGTDGDDRRDARGWVATSPDPVTLRLTARVAPGDALEEQWGMNALGQDVGLVGIELGTKRRNRVNGRITAVVPAVPPAGHHEGSSRHTMTFTVDQSFGNCPQYISPRQWYWRRPARRLPSKDPIRGTALSRAQADRIRRADTIFIATGYRGQRGNDDDGAAGRFDDGSPARSFGNDASHRGGPPGFLKVPNSTTVLLPDYSGNNFYNSIGNLLLDPRMGISVPGFEAGSLLQLSGTAQVLTGTEAMDLYPGIETLIVFTVERVNDLPEGSLPIRWSNDAAERRVVRVTSIVSESQDVKSFELEPNSPQDAALWPYRAGQYVPVHLSSARDGPMVRTYSLSRAPGFSTGPNLRYRISVKRHGKGKASGFLHDSVRVGDVLSVEAPVGDFTLSPEDATSGESLVVLISAGIGITPVLSMLQELARGSKTGPEAETAKLEPHASPRADRRRVMWIHGARNREQHSFRREVEDLVSRSRATSSIVNVSKCVVYSKPSESDVLGEDYDFAGRIDLPLLRRLLVTETASKETGLKDARYFICGPPDFVSTIEEGLQDEGVALNQIHYESF
jgi:ferredoxin-NADP reductase/predicted pyridoxine 5'-phosphate oxidase superfamily flavin-nucleotide-binding protein